MSRPQDSNLHFNAVFRGRGSTKDSLEKASDTIFDVQLSKFRPKSHHFGNVKSQENPHCCAYEGSATRASVSENYYIRMIIH